ncbi:MAG TPA: ribonuclease HI [Flavobacteriaceae bacterium]|jgi:ribonuclease HI|nr:ribonuclease HI [Flavobacteriaceae bacterium]MDP7183818.1 ribonuclease HI [Flavobacteriaceae bacterium]HJO70811.1 ribonuclease HI [Flavobacteriaceae bacterium]|tara:strand:- start:582 stop:1058 length:477 start_codon:yes stop_codon:yes gene_type:complete
MSKKINIYTDGSSIGNPGPGGYGIIMVLENNAYKKEVSQGFSLTTNNRMELLAVIVALENIKIINSNVEVFTDSKYVSDGVEKKWVFEWEKLNFKKKKNPDLWKRFLIIYRKHNVTFTWIKGHNNQPENERCDYMANKAARSSNLIKDTYYEQNIKRS